MRLVTVLQMPEARQEAPCDAGDGEEIQEPPELLDPTDEEQSGFQCLDSSHRAAPAPSLCRTWRLKAWEEMWVSG